MTILFSIKNLLNIFLNLQARRLTYVSLTFAEATSGSGTTEGVCTRRTTTRGCVTHLKAHHHPYGPQIGLDHYCDFVNVFHRSRVREPLKGARPPEGVCTTKGAPHDYPRVCEPLKAHNHPM